MNAGMTTETIEAVLEKLEADLSTPDLAGLCSIYAAWCSKVSFDSSLKMIYLHAGGSGPLPGSTAESFFQSWLKQGTGGTCWAGNGALHDLLDALGFDVERAIATMLPAPDIRSPNHGSVIVTLDSVRWIADASILSGKPIRIPEPDEPPTDGPLPRFEWYEYKPSVVWRMLAAPEGFPCRIERIGADVPEWDAYHQRTANWSPFNHQLNLRVLRGESSIGIALGQRFEFDKDGRLATEQLDRDGRLRFMIEDIGISEESAARVPDDSPVPPRPEGR